MKSILILLTTGLLFTSCLVVKIYDSSKPNYDNAEKVDVQKRYIGSGKVVVLKENEPREIFFIGKEEQPKGFFFEGISKTPQDSIHNRPLLIIDGKINEEIDFMNSIDPNTIESVNVLKGEQAVKQYGEKGHNGVVEIMLKK